MASYPISFFFSHFPTNFGEYEMWKNFRRWGKVQEVFIPRRTNKYGHRFGFVRFIGISDSDKLEYQLDNIWIGNMKLHVSKPKYRRSYKGGRVEIDRGQQKRRDENGSKKVEPRVRKVWRRKGEISYAQAVKNGIHTRISSEKWMGQIMQVKVEDKEWMKRSCVGYLNETADIEDIKNSFFMNGANFIRLRYLGDNAMLLTPEGDTSVEDLIKENKEWLEEIFDEITPWDNSVRVAQRRVWVRVWGLPFHLWEWSVFVNVVINIGNLLAVDKTTENFDELQYARVLVSIPFVAEARTSKRMMINETIYQIHIEEDLTCCDKSNERKENEVSWSESFVGDEECESNYDNASESEKLMPTNQNMKSEFNHIGISSEIMSEDRYDSPVLRDVLKSCFSDTVVPDSLSHGNGYIRRSQSNMLQVSPSAAQECGLSESRAQFGEQVDGKNLQNGLDAWPRCTLQNDALHVIPNVHGSSTTQGDSRQMRNGPQGANSVQMLEEGGEGDNPLPLYETINPSGGRHEREDEALMIGGAATRTQTGEAKEDNVLKGKDAKEFQGSMDVISTPNSGFMRNHMSLIKQTNINPNSMLQRSNILIGESSKIQKQSSQASRIGVRRKSKRLVNKHASNRISDSGIRNCNRMFWLKNSPMDAVNLWDLAKKMGFSYSGDEEDVINS
ncbi:hypothetical protein PHAVU_009G011500 [Phaseolus vulgaris]|uniref:RRM domain-containing protein n=1 Tax=Phaseolus vulgaris TaxID=3885 RepID=V7AUW5_PHAVU|nr:hypothetical protein PHAVU_009G011500g [Phaseolus vulgaris]ESW08016.1 hypothetical protein PHAVU_009G011500g [Phaseolus vulgaris]